MSLSPAVLDALLQAGATAEMIVAAVKAQAEQDAAREALEREENDARKARQREANAERQRRHRERNAQSRVTDVTNGDERDTPPVLDKEIPPRPPKEINPTPSVVTARALPRKAGGFSAPDGVSDDRWASFCQQRKKSITRIAYDRIVRTLAEGADAGWPPGELIERSIERGYETVFVPSENRNGQHRPAPGQQSGITNPRLAAAIELETERRGRERSATF